MKFSNIVSLSAKSFVNVDEMLLKTKQGNQLYAYRTTVSDHPSQMIGDRSQTVGSWIPFIDASGELLFSVLVLKSGGEEVSGAPTTFLSFHLYYSYYRLC